MGRKKIKKLLKKRLLSVTIKKNTYDSLENLLIKNKSKLVNELLVKYFDIENKMESKSA